MISFLFWDRSSPYCLKFEDFWVDINTDRHEKCPSRSISHVTIFSKKTYKSTIGSTGLYAILDKLISYSFLIFLVQNTQKSQSHFPRTVAPISFSIALGHASANAVKATARGWSTGSSACLTFPLHPHMSSARHEGSEYHF